MRTTVEIRDEQRATLLALAAQRGEKGFSRLIQEAIDLYLDGMREREEAIEAARAVLGTLNDRAAEDLRRSVRTLRERWR